MATSMPMSICLNLVKNLVYRVKTQVRSLTILWVRVLVRSFSVQSIGISHYGIREVEAALSEPDKPTQYFPPAQYILDVEQMINSQVQHGTHNSTQTGTFTASDPEALRKFVETFKSRLPDLPLNETDKAEASAEIATIEAQLQSPKPKRDETPTLHCPYFKGCC